MNDNPATIINGTVSQYVSTRVYEGIRTIRDKDADRYRQNAIKSLWRLYAHKFDKALEWWTG